MDKPKVKPIDGHAHLDGLRDLEEDLADARKAGIYAIIGVGMNLSSNQKIMEIAGKHPGFVFPAIGYHPWEIREGDVDATLSFIEEHIERCVAMGEVGLDYKVKVKKRLQQQVLAEIVKLAHRFDKPLILHGRPSYRRIFTMVAEGKVKQAVFHWYSGPGDLLRDIIAAGYYVSATPALAHSEAHRAAIKAAPLERILLETDCPVAHEGRDSRPSDVFITARLVADIKAVPENAVITTTTESAKAMFSLP